MHQVWNAFFSLISLYVFATPVALTALGWTAGRVRRELSQRQRDHEQIKKLRLLLRHAAHGIIRMDLQGRIIAVDERWAHHMDWTVPEIVGKHWRQLFHPQDAARMNAALANVDDNPVEIEARTWQNFGCESHQRLTIFQARAENGKLTGYECICKDITESRRVEENLRLQKALFQAVSEASAEGILVFSADRRLICFNRRLREMFELDEKYLHVGESADGLLCQIFQSSDPSSTLQSRLAQLNDSISQQEGGEFHQRSRLFQLSTASLQGENLPINGRAWFFRDITDKRRVTEQLLQARDNADAANRAKSTFLANVSHEIRTPMTAVLGYAELMILHCRDLDSDLLQWAQTIHRGAQRLVNLMNEILEFSKIEAGRITIESAPAQIREIVQEIIELFKPQALEQNLQVQAEYQEEVPAQIYTDAGRVRQIITNLVGNALKFTESGGVKIIVANADSRLRIEVIDTGIGMTPEQQSQLFQPFNQARGPGRPARPGSGLGLAISRRLARLLQGDIVCESTPAAGSRFTFTLPAALDAPAPPAAATSLPTLLHNLRNARILIADDVAMIREYISTALSLSGAIVTAVDNGLAAVQTALRSASDGAPFDVILMDMQMPVLDGFGATRSLRQSGYCGTIIALTALTTDSDRKRALDAGCDDFQPKPLDRPDLIARIAQYISPAQRQAA